MDSELTRFDLEHVWHPYTSLTDPLPTYEVVSLQRGSLTGCPT